MEINLDQLLSDIEAPEAEAGNTSRYQVLKIPGFDKHYIGKDINGAPCLLISSTDSGVKPPLRLAGIEAYFALKCQILEADDQEKVETLTVVTCTAREPSLQTYFCYVGEVLLKIIGVSPTLQQVAEAVWKLVALFQKLSQPPAKPVMGLWGELYAIYRSQNPALAMQAWRSGTDDRFDFSMQNLRMEVKTTGTRTRTHEFSFEQCNLPSDTKGVLVSLIAEPTGSGTTLRSLIDRINGQIRNNAELVLKLYNNVADTLGQSLTSALDKGFDERIASDS